MARKYTQSRRAEQAAETRLKIVEAAIDLHGSIGPAQTSLSMVAAKAGVQRHTLYAHFPDERSLLMACSGLSLERNPLPDPEPWRAIADLPERLRTGLGAIYAWYERNARLAACVLRDAEHHAPTRETVALRHAPHREACLGILGEGLGPRQLALLRVALSFYAWRSLAEESGLGPAAAAETMTAAIFNQPARNP